MYEPVSDRCVTTIISPKYANHNAFDPGDEGCTRTNELVPPEKPPRKNKMNKQSKQESNEVCDGVSLKTKNSTKMKSENGDTCIDVDHVTLEANNYKNKYTNASVQTSPLIPYRLRFWPRSTCDVKCDPNENGCCTKIRLTCCCRILSQWVLSQVGLTVVVLSWALLGAFAFYKTEGPRELEQSENLAKLQNNLSVNLAKTLQQTDQQHWTFIINNYLKKHETSLLEAVSAGLGEGGGGSIWTYPGCILFAVSLLTTLGFGAPVPRTSLGRGAAVLFSAIGIPLHFLLILNMGNLGAVRLQQLAFGSSSTDIPILPRPKWLKWFPVAAIAFYYLMGVILFGFVRQRCAVDSFMFPLDFTAAGGVATTDGHVRILYALYLEFAVTLAALVLSLIQASATRGIVDVGLRLGLLTNT
ncbi:uncoordinated protein 58-like isoform X1 [Tenebrio molitor]|uniref:uncoordinated protein 58-like isoform X1 n=1 Tax=Tenebrio molitor TaxID=7067 RepID=UPI003624774A